MDTDYTCKLLELFSDGWYCCFILWQRQHGVDGVLNRGESYVHRRLGTILRRRRVWPQLRYPRHTGHPQKYSTTIAQCYHTRSPPFRRRNSCTRGVHSFLAQSDDEAYIGGTSAVLVNVAVRRKR